MVDSQALLRAANAVAGDGVALTIADDALMVSGGRRRFSIATLPGADAPQIPAIAGKARKVKGSLLSSLIRRVSHTMHADQDPKNGVLIRQTGNEIEAMASDGRGAAIDSRPIEKGTEFSAQIPSSMVPILVSTFDTDESVKLSVTDERIFATLDGATVSVSRRENELLAAVDVRKWVDQVADGVSVLADAETLRESVAIVGAGAPHLRLTTAREGLSLWAAANGSHVEDEVSCRCDGERISFIDPARFGAALKGLSGEIALNIGDTVITVRSGNYLATIAPMDPRLAAA
jgi:hypothetical protein